MGVLWARLFDRTGSMDNKFHREYTERYRVGLDDPTTPELTILLSALLPQVNSSFATDLFALAQKPQVDMPDDEDPNLRIVTVPYSTQTLDPSRENNSPNQSPIQKPPKARWAHVVGKRLFDKTVDGTPVRRIINGVDQTSPATFANIPAAINPPVANWPVQNTAGKVFDQVPETEERRQTLRVVRNEATFDPNQADSFIGTTNASVWDVDGYTAPPGTALCVEFSGEREYEKMVPYRVVTYAFEFADDWDIILRDHGTYGIDPAGSSDPTKWKTVLAIGPNGQPLDANLNGLNGGMLPMGSPPVYLGFRRFLRSNFDALNLVNL